MPLANSGDPWRAQIGNSNATVVNNAVSLTITPFVLLYLFYFGHFSLVLFFPFYSVTGINLFTFQLTRSYPRWLLVARLFFPTFPSYICRLCLLRTEVLVKQCPW